MRVVLASASPQRRQILTWLGLDFIVCAVDVKELSTGDADEAALTNAKAKAAGARTQLHKDEFSNTPVLAADTVISLEGQIYGKPSDQAEACSFIDQLSGRTHQVKTAHVLLDASGAETTKVISTDVSFRQLSDHEISAYVALGEWEGRAGGYAIQQAGATLLERIDGDYLNVVGLSASWVLEKLPA